MRVQTIEQAIQTIHNIYDCNGYRETGGNNWLGTRLGDIEDFLNSLTEESKGE